MASKKRRRKAVAPPPKPKKRPPYRDKSGRFAKRPKPKKVDVKKKVVAKKAVARKPIVRKSVPKKKVVAKKHKPVPSTKKFVPSVETVVINGQSYRVRKIRPDVQPRPKRKKQSAVSKRNEGVRARNYQVRLRKEQRRIEREARRGEPERAQRALEELTNTQALLATREGRLELLEDRHFPKSLIAQDGGSPKNINKALSWMGIFAQYKGESLPAHVYRQLAEEEDISASEVYEFWLYNGGLN